MMSRKKRKQVGTRDKVSEVDRWAALAAAYTAQDHPPNVILSLALALGVRTY